MEQRDKGKLERALSRHSIDGYPVHVPIFGDGTVKGEGGRSLNQIYYRIRPDKPMRFEEYAASLRLDPLPRQRATAPAQQWGECRGRRPLRRRG